MKIKVKVIPNSLRNEIDKKEDYYLVKLKSSPENNKANIELIRILAKYFNTTYNNIKLKRGKTSRNKILEIS